MKDYELYLNKLVEDSIIAKGQRNDILLGLKEISGKLDTLITLKQVELSRQLQKPEQRSRQ